MISDRVAELAPQGLLHQLRAAEIEAVARWLPSGARVLDFGGGDGFQATLMANRGCQVSSIDVAPRVDDKAQWHGVQRYDGDRIPFSDATFDVVFSSNVLEHVLDLTKTLAELRRVCRPEGYGVHLMPSSAWRLWTNITHGPWLVERAIRWGGPRAERERGSRGATRSNPSRVALKALGLASHGVRGSAWSEIYHFSRQRWRRVFEREGFIITHESPNGLFYTGHMLLPGLPMPVRRRLAGALGSACNIFVVKSIRAPE
jgi:SAM-dependent methyltransferase